jgi:periplasmic protein TonB
MKKMNLANKKEQALTFIKKYLSPKTMTGAIFYSVTIHLSLVGAVNGISRIPSEPVKDETVQEPDDYQYLDVPPEKSDEEKTIINTPTPAVEPTTPQENVQPSDKELHDEKGETAGTKEEEKQAAGYGSKNRGDSTATAYYKIRPKYPRAAAIRGIEGWVMLKVDVTEKGEVQNVRVLEGKNTNYFAFEAKRAVEKWKYRPFLNKDRVPIKRKDVMIRVDFKMKD